MKTLTKVMVAAVMTIGVGIPVTASAWWIVPNFNGHDSQAGCSRCMQFCNCIYPGGYR